MYGYESLKLKYKCGKVRLTHEQSTHLKQYRRWHSESYLLICQLIILCILVCIYIPIFITDAYYNSNNYACHIQQPPFWNPSTADDQSPNRLDSFSICWLIYMVINLPLNIYLIIQLRRMQSSGIKDSIGLLNEMLVSANTIYVSYLVFQFLTWFKYNTYMVQWDYYYIVTYQPSIYCLVWIVYPSLHNTTRARKLRYWYRRNVLGRTIQQTDLIDDITDLRAILSTQLGFGYMLLQCQSEFSEETIQCLKSIWSYKDKPTYPKLLQLYNTYIEEYSPFQVNIAASTRYKLSKQILIITPVCSVIEIQSIFDIVEDELIKLLINNSYVRFKRSMLYTNYLNNVPLPVTHDTSSTHHTSTNTHTNTATNINNHQTNNSRITPGQSSRLLDGSVVKLHVPPAQSYKISVDLPVRAPQCNTTVQRSQTSNSLFDTINSQSNQHNIDRQSYTDDVMSIKSRNKQLATKPRTSIKVYGSMHHRRDSTIDTTLLPNQVDECTPSIYMNSQPLISNEFNSKQTYVAPRMRLAVLKSANTSDDTGYTINISG